MGRMIGFIDPGTESGWALGWNGALVGCGLIHVKLHAPLDLSGLTALVLDSTKPKIWIEEPEYRREKNRVDVNDLIALGLKVGRFQDRCLWWGWDVHVVRPSGWKGGVPKHIHHPRIRKELRSQESKVLEWGLDGVAEGQQHNVLDAVGGFLWAARKEGLR